MGSNVQISVAGGSSTWTEPTATDSPLDVTSILIGGGGNASRLLGVNR